MQKDWFEEIITTIENNSEDNKATITNVELWAKSWREERELALTLYGVVKSSYCYAVNNKKNKCKTQCLGCLLRKKRLEQ